MSHSYLWQKKTFYYSMILVILYFLISIVLGQSTLCSQQSKNSHSLLFVSTLDGKLSALDANYGQKQWTLDFNDGPMLSSNIHDIDLDNNGQFVRLIPSLSGGLYKSDGQNIETVPILTGQLLHSLYRFSNDLVFSGGNKIHSYGISANTGEILYECRVAGCKNNTDHEEYLEQDVLIIQRFQQTMRAVEVQTGNERWNFSVGQHDLMLIPAARDVYCSNKFTALDIEIKVVIPEGLIWAVDKNNPTVKLWQYKFDSPIVTIWREGASQSSTNQQSLEQINLFDSSQWTWGLEQSSTNPSLYLGVYKKQLYVQENLNLLKDMLNSSNHIQHTKYPWQLYPAAVTAIASTLPNENNKYSDEEEKAQTALSVLVNSEYVNGNGFYLYSKNQYENDSSQDFNIMLLTTGTKNTMYYDFIKSIWNWWKEILIVLGTMIILWIQFLYTRRVVIKDAISPPLIIERHIETKINDLTNDDSENISNFMSRYLTDFEPINCLGKGGYGVVFEAKNKIDDCNYAIKRIALPNSQDSRERVMREVKALAKLDHHNIVRYFNAWLECPPPGWQKEHDQQWINKLQSLSSGFSSEITQTETKRNDSVCINVSQADLSSRDSAYDALELNKINTNNDLSIAFENSSSKQYDNDAVCIDACSTDSSDLSSSKSASERKFSNDSESIVFEETDNNIVIEKSKDKRPKSISLDLNNKPNDYKSTKMFLYIQMQLCQKLSLKEWLKQHISARNSPQILNIFQQIVDAVDYVHRQELIHRDLKPSNIFFGYDGKIKIGDFGLVTAMTESQDGSRTPEAENKNVVLKDSRHTACVGTHLYMSPEQKNGQNYNYKVDIYSLGIIFFELLTPFATEMQRIIALSDLRKSIFPKNFAEDNPVEYDLLKMMLDEDPAKRPTTYCIKTRSPLSYLQNHETVDFTIL